MLTRQSILAVAGAVAAFSVAGSAFAQEDGSYFRTRVLAPKRALELSPGLSYSAPFGEVAKGANVRDFAGSALAPQLGIAYRVVPEMALGVTGFYQEFSAGNDTNDGITTRGRARAVGVGPDITVHFRPYQRVDPFLRGGFGYRAMWEVRDGGNNDVVRHGFELGRLALGLDMRMSKDIAIAPVLAANANMFLWQSRDNGGRSSISDPRVNVSVSAGFEARFDLGGDRVYNSTDTAVLRQLTTTTTTTSAAP